MHRFAASFDTDPRITRNGLAALNRFAPFPDLDAACSIRPRPFGMPAPLEPLAFNIISHDSQGFFPTTSSELPTGNDT